MPRSFIKSLLSLLALLAIMSKEVSGEFEEERSEPLIIFAASSAASTLERIFDAAPNFPEPKIVIGPSGTLARQIAAGAPADIYISANKDWVDYLESKEALKSEPQPLIANRLVLAVPTGHARISDGLHSLTDTLASFDRIAIADPKIAPLGRYSIDYLKNLDIWNQLRDKAAYSQSARQTFRLIETAGLPGFAYKSDVVQSDTVSLLMEIDNADRVPIIYQAAITAQSDNKAAAQAAIDYLLSEEAAKIWQSQGFSLLNDKDSISGDH
jgi:molybdate transport system substrate-binding protein